MSTVKAALAQFPILWPSSWSELANTLADWVARAAQQGAQLLVFPEYAGMALTALLAPPLQSDLRGQLAALAEWQERWRDLHCQLARQHHLTLLAGSLPWREADGRIVNRAWLCTPAGAEAQDKIVMTRFEREDWGVQSPAAPLLRVFQTPVGRVAVAICYDSEFPLLARAQAEAGAELLLVPSCTDTRAGYWRVRTGCAARALENQCYVLQSPLVGAAPASPAVDINLGTAHVYTPPDRGFPDDGLLASGEADQPQWVYATLDLDRLHRVRREGQVLNHQHWPEQAAAFARAVHRVDLS